MVINVLDRIGQKVAKGKQADFFIEPADEVIQAKPSRLLEPHEQSTTVSGVFLDTTCRHLFRWYEIGSTANSLKVTWQQEEDVSAITHEPSEDELLDSWDRYLAEHWDELVAQYKGKYVAIWKGTVYDSDEDLPTLAERVYAALGYRPIFMPYIGEKEQVYEFTSPL